MIITELQVQDIKNIKVININPDGNEVKIVGYNGAGKTAALESIEMALTGEKIENPIRNGKKKGEINVRLGEVGGDELILKKTFTPSGARLEITTPDDSVPKKSPQKYLDNIIGELCFDPLDFIEKKPKLQREMLLKFIDFDFDNYTQKREAAYTSRKGYNRDINKYEIELEAYSDVDQNTPLTLTPIDKKLKTLDNMKKIRHYRSDEIESIDGIEYEIINQKSIITKAQQKIKELENAQTKKRISLKAIPNYTTEQIDVLNNEIMNIDVENLKISRAGERAKISEKLEQARRDAKKYDDKINDFDDKKLKAIVGGKYPISGLSVNEDAVLYNNVPITSLSSAEKVKIAVGIAMALNPKIRVILIREGSLLDKKMHKAIIDLAKIKNYQVWIEKVYTGIKGGIYFEEGEITDFPEEEDG